MNANELRKTEERLVTPEIAKNWLDRCNTRNRPVKKSLVAKYARLMTEGLWGITPDAISFDQDGVILNGQHRLQALVQSGTEQVFTISTGWPKETYGMIDTGCQRTSRDVLQLNGYQNAASLASAVNLIIAAETTRKFYSFASRTAEEIEIFMKEYGEEMINTLTCYGKKLQNKNVTDIRLFPEAALIAMMCVLEKHGHKRQDIIDFFHNVLCGENLKKGQPAFALRSRLLKNKSSIAKLKNDYICKISIKAFKASIQGKCIDQLSVRDDEIISF
jgi:hypothetical protein